MKMNKNSRINIFYGIYFTISVLIVLGVLKGFLSFGLGLGDIGMLIVLVFSLFVLGVGVYFKKGVRKKFPQWDVLVILCMTLFLIYFLLSLSFWRGSENPWDGVVVF